MSQPHHGRRRANSRNRERDIVLTAAHIIHTDGFSRLNVDDLAKKVGISKSTLYQHFDHKSDIVRFALNMGAQTISGFLAETGGAPLDRLEALLRFLHRYQEDDNSSIAGVVFTEAIKQIKEHDDAFDCVKEMLDFINSIIKDGKATGQIKETLSTDVVRGSLFSTAILLSSHYLPTKLTTDDTYVDQVVNWWRSSLA